MLLAITPRHLLDRHSAGKAVDTPQRVNEERSDIPERHELEPLRWKLALAGPLLAAARADRPAIGPRGWIVTSISKPVPIFDESS